MSYSYNKLWKLLIDKGMLKKDLISSFPEIDYLNSLFVCHS